MADADAHISASVLLEKLEQWHKDRLDNCHRIACEKSGADRQGWLDDAAAFNATLVMLAKLSNGLVASAARERIYAQALDAIQKHALDPLNPWPRATVFALIADALDRAKAVK